eukprot:7376345-Prymnesium_polylepis.1
MCRLPFGPLPSDVRPAFWALPHLSLQLSSDVWVASAGLLPHLSLQPSPLTCALRWAAATGDAAANFLRTACSQLGFQHSAVLRRRVAVAGPAGGRTHRSAHCAHRHLLLHLHLVRCARQGAIRGGARADRAAAASLPAR